MTVTFDTFPFQENIDWAKETSIRESSSQVFASDKLISQISSVPTELSQSELEPDTRFHLPAQRSFATFSMQLVLKSIKRCFAAAELIPGIDAKKLEEVLLSALDNPDTNLPENEILLEFSKIYKMLDEWRAYWNDIRGPIES